MTFSKSEPQNHKTERAYATKHRKERNLYSIRVLILPAGTSSLDQQ